MQGGSDNCLLHRRSRGSESLGAYAISKAADMQIARNLAVEWGPKNIRVNCIAPGLIRTDFARALWENPEITKRPCQSTCSGASVSRMRLPVQLSFWRPLPAVLQPGRLLSLMAAALSQGDGFIGYAYS